MACPTMARNSPTVVVARYFLKSFAHFLRQRPDNFCRSLRGAAAESNATNAVQDGGSTADLGPSKELPWLAPSARRPGCSATPALELTVGLITVGALAAADALEHMSLRTRQRRTR